MKFQVERWSRAINSQSNYEDKWTPLGKAEVRLKGGPHNMYCELIQKGEIKVLQNVFKVEIEDHLEIYGFIPDEPHWEFWHIRCKNEKNST